MHLSIPKLDIDVFTGSAYKIGDEFTESLHFPS